MLIVEATVRRPPGRPGRRPVNDWTVEASGPPGRWPGHGRGRHLATAFQLVLNESGTVTRADIARRTGLTPATVSSLLADLEARGWVRIGEPRVHGRGRPAALLSVDPQRQGLMAVSIGSSRGRFAVLGLDGNQVAAWSGAVRKNERVSTWAAGRARELAQGCGRSLLAIGVTTASDSFADGRTGEGSSPLVVADELENAVGVPVVSVDEAAAGALGEATTGAAGDRSMLFLHLARGVSAAILQRGEWGASVTMAGDIGHVQVQVGGNVPTCRCGLDGCLESVSSIPAMLGYDHTCLPVDRILAGITRPDRRYRVNYGAHRLAQTAQLICAALGLSGFVVGGDAPVLGPTFLIEMRDALRRLTPRGRAPVEVRYATLVDPVLGPAQAALQFATGVVWSRRVASS